MAFPKMNIHNVMEEVVAEHVNNLYDEVKKLLQVNLSERHIRGGIATRKKYKY